MTEMLSQDEIDKLLRGEIDTDISINKQIVEETQKPEFEFSALHNINGILSDVEKDAVGEIANIAMGSAATALSTLINKRVEITTPQVKVINTKELKSPIPAPFILIEVEYTEGLKGTNVLFIKERDAAIITNLMMGGDGSNPDEELSELHISAIQEAMNQMMGSSATSMCTILQKKTDISPPTARQIDLATTDLSHGLFENDKIVQVEFRMTIEDLIDSSLLQFVTVDFAKDITKFLLGDIEKIKPLEEDVIDFVQKQEEKTPILGTNNTASTMGNEQVIANSNINQQNQQIPYGIPPNYYQPFPGYVQMPIYPYGYQPVPPGIASPGYPPQVNIGNAIGGQENKIEVQPVKFPSFESGNNNGNNNLAIMQDVPVQVRAELGRTIMKIKDILEIGTGSVIPIDRLSGEPIDIYINNKLIAKAEVVTIGEQFGVRIVELIK